MTPERWRQVEEIVHAALSRHESERVAFLAHACASDLALRREVEVLLARQASGLLEGPAVAAVGETLSNAGDSSLTGRRLGSYQVYERIGMGGMGEVYRARDTKLGRDVAIKILPRLFTSDPDRLARFEREARVLAYLNHPHIGAIYGVEDADGMRALVLELVKGDTLAERLSRGPIPLKDALAIAGQIIEALDAAHEKGIIHRDLKPANIKITPDGVVKVLDFGLAKAASGKEASADLTQAPTITFDGTREGVILGTPAYMSPEQARGQAADKRIDIWAFGCVLYEILTGRAAFRGATVSDTLAAILERDPDWGAISESVPPGVLRVVQRCLTKDPRRRLHDIADARIEMEEALGPTTMSSAWFPHAPDRRSGAWREHSAWIVATTLLLIVLAVVARWPRPVVQPTEIVRLSVNSPESAIFTPQIDSTVSILQFALSPDGRSLAFLAGPPALKPTLWLRHLEDVEARSMAGTDDARDPFWSADGRWIGFFDAQGILKRVAVSGGTVQTVARNIPDPRGASWGPDDTILVGTGYGEIYRVAAAGGTPQRATHLNSSKNEGSHRWPQFLPDGRHFLFTVRSGLADDRGVYVGALDEETRHQVLRVDTDAHYVAPGYLLFMDGDTLLAQPFDSDRLILSGQPTPFEAGVGRSSRGNTAISASRTGTIAYAGATPRTGRLTWFDRSGTALGTVGPDGERDYSDFRLSGDEKRLAVSLVDPKVSVPDIWVFDLARGAASRLTFGPALNAAPVWSPQGDRIAFRTNRQGVLELYQKSAVAGGNDEPLVPADIARRAGVGHSTLLPSDWSSDGQRLAFAGGEPADIWLLTMADPTKPHRIVQSPGEQMHANFSPDGRFIAYSSNESGRFDVYVQSLLPPARTWPISVNGGYEPRWRSDGRELYYLADDRMLMAVPVSSGAVPFGVPRPLFQTQVHAGVSSIRTHYVPNRDGSRFLIHRRSHDVASPTITVVLNGMMALKR